MDSLERDLKRFQGKKYQTESFQNQIWLLQSENEEILRSLKEIQAEITQERQENQQKTLEIIQLKACSLDPSAVQLLRQTPKKVSIKPSQDLSIRKLHLRVCSLACSA